MKKRVVNNNSEEINSKICEAMKKKLGQKEESDSIRSSRYSESNQSPNKLKISLEEDVLSLSSRIEKYCIVSKQSLRRINNDRSKSRSKSPLKLTFNKENENPNSNINKLEEAHFFSNLSTNSIISSSIRKNFNKIEATEDKILNEMKNQKFKAKPMSKNLFKGVTTTTTVDNISTVVNKQPEILSFESVLQKTRAETHQIMQKEKDKKRDQKLMQMKKRSLLNKENINTSNFRSPLDIFGDNDMMLIEK